MANGRLFKMTLDADAQCCTLPVAILAHRPNNFTERHPSLAYICARIASVAGAISQILCENRGTT